MIDDIKRTLQNFFPGQTFPVSDLEIALKKGDILTEKEKILPFLQTALFDEKVLEVELDGMPRVYFSRLKDDFSDFIEDEEDFALLDEHDYTQGEYLKEMSHIVTLPLEPGLGNLHLRHSRSIALRIFTNTFAVELATTFEDLTKVGDLPVLRLAFPILARIVHNAREFRAKVPDSLNFVLNIEIAEDLPKLDTTPIDISIKGMAFTVSKNEQKMFIPGAAHSLKLYVNDELLTLLKGTVRHLSKVRKKGGIEYVCGVQFDLETRTLAAVVESIVASVQRAHLKDLAEKSDASGIDLIA
ncbi:MAG: hypothetical protein GQ542_08570 [Desulforhopalus sp.]|nr:hypothetical protein [Desulforhopalus sp.]